jgi:flagellar FliL protein
MRMIIMAVGALAVLGGGGAGAYFYFSQEAEAAVSEEGADAHGDEHATEEDHGGGHDDHGGHVEYVELDPLILPIVDNEGVSQVVSVVIAIEVPDAEAKGKVEAMAPKLKDAFIQDMYGVLNKHAALKGGVLQVNMLKERLNTVSMEVMGKDKIKDVLLQVVQQRPI